MVVSNFVFLILIPIFGDSWSKWTCAYFSNGWWEPPETTGQALLDPALCKLAAWSLSLFSRKGRFITVTFRLFCFFFCIPLVFLVSTLWYLSFRIIGVYIYIQYISYNSWLIVERHWFAFIVMMIFEELGYLRDINRLIYLRCSHWTPCIMHTTTHGWTVAVKVSRLRNLWRRNWMESLAKCGGQGMILGFDSCHVSIFFAGDIVVVFEKLFMGMRTKRKLTAFGRLFFVPDQISWLIKTVLRER